MAGLLGGDVITPDKKDKLIAQIKDEIAAISGYLKNKQFGDAAITIAQRNKQELQRQFDLLMQKSGIITPEEKDRVMEALNVSKRERLKNEYLFGIKKTTLYIVGAVALIYGTWFYFKKYKQ